MSVGRKKGTRLGRRQRNAYKLRLLEDYGGCCHLCGLSLNMNLPYTSMLYFTFDHIIPWSRGGSDSIENLAPAHFICNFLRSNKPVDYCSNYKFYNQLFSKAHAKIDTGANVAWGKALLDSIFELAPSIGKVVRGSDLDPTDGESNSQILLCILSRV